MYKSCTCTFVATCNWNQYVLLALATMISTSLIVASMFLSQMVHLTSHLSHLLCPKHFHFVYKKHAIEHELQQPWKRKNTSHLLLCYYHIVGIYNQSLKLLHPKIVVMSMLDIPILWLVLLNSRSCCRFGVTMLHVSLIFCFSMVWFLHPLATPYKETNILLNKL